MCCNRSVHFLREREREREREGGYATKSGSLKIKFSKILLLTVGMINGSVVNHLFSVVMLCHDVYLVLLPRNIVQE